MCIRDRDGTDYEKMCKREHELLVNRKNRCWNRYYNESLGDIRYIDTSGENNSMYGKTHSLKTKKKMSESHTGKTITEETKEKIRIAQTGKTLTEETKKKMSEANIGKTITEEVKKKISISMKKFHAKKQGVGTLTAFMK